MAAADVNDVDSARRGDPLEPRQGQQAAEPPRQRGRPGSPWPETMLYRNAQRGQHTGSDSPHIVGVLRATETPCVNGLRELVANKPTEMGRRGLWRSGSVFVSGSLRCVPVQAFAT